MTVKPELRPVTTRAARAAAQPRGPRMPILAGLICLLVAVAAAPGQAQTRDAPHVVAIRGDFRLNVRSAPSTDFEIIDMAYAGERVFVLERFGDWVRIEQTRPGSDWGWVTGNVILPMASPTEWRMVRETTTGYLNLRAGPGTGFDVLREMPIGTRVFVLAAQDNWRYVRDDTYEHGWAWAESLIPVPAEAPAFLPRIGAGRN